MNDFRDSEKDRDRERFVVSFMLEEANLNLMQKAKG